MNPSRLMLAIKSLINVIQNLECSNLMSGCAGGDDGDGGGDSVELFIRNKDIFVSIYSKHKSNFACRIYKFSNYTIWMELKLFLTYNCEIYFIHSNF